MASASYISHPGNLLVNANLATHDVWSLGENVSYVDADDGRPALLTRGADTVQKQLNGESEHAGGAVQYGVIPNDAATLLAACECRVDWFTPYTTKGNFAHLSLGHNTWAFCILEQLDLGGDVVRRDEVFKRTAPGDWERGEVRVAKDPRARFFSLSMGIYNGTGKVYFRPEAVLAFDAEETPVTNPNRNERSTPRAAVFFDPTLPGAWSPSQIDHLEQALGETGFEIERLDAGAIANPTSFNQQEYDLVILTHGPYFPADARESLLLFLKAGGHLLTVGGYAFQRIVHSLRPAASGSTASDGDEPQWIEQDDHIAVLTGVHPAPVGSELKPGRSILPDLDEHQGDEIRIRGEKAVEVSLNPGSWYALHADVGEDGLDFYSDALVRVEQFDTAGRRVWGWNGQLMQEAPDEAGEWQHFCMPIKAHYDQAKTRIAFVAPVPRRRNHDGDGALILRKPGLVELPELVHLNTSFGFPSDSILTKPPQIGIFDLDYCLERAVSLSVASEQRVLTPELWSFVRPIRGWAASGQTKNDDAAWKPLLEAYDRYGRPRGPAAAMLRNHAGFFAGSNWAYFGLEETEYLTKERLRDLARVGWSLCVPPAIRVVEARYDTYHPGESLAVRLVVSRPGSGSWDARVEVVTESGEVVLEKLIKKRGNVAPGTPSTEYEVEWDAGEVARALGDDAFYIVRAVLCSPGRGGAIFDEAVSGFSVARDDILDGGADVRFKENGFYLDGHPTVLFGADAYQNVFFSSYNTPLRIREALAAARDMGIRVYENLHYIPDRLEFDEFQRRALDGVLYQTQELGMVYMPCLLVLTSVLVGPEAREQQAQLCRWYAGRWSRARGLIYYFNGDLGGWIPEPREHGPTWRSHLMELYGSLGMLKEAWGDRFDPDRGWDQELPQPHVRSSDWDDLPARDLARFLPALCREWNRTMNGAIREVDEVHATTDEFSRRPHGGNDIQQGIDGLSHANIEAFGPARLDVYQLPGIFSLSDLRSRGKGVGVGEYGAKTHPAQRYSPHGYGARRSREGQFEHFMAVQHYALGRGARKIQHWCLSDGTEWCFPWGIFYPNGAVPKPIASEVRNASILFNHLPLANRPPSILLVVPDALRLGPQGERATEALFTAASTLCALQTDFAVVSEDYLEELTFSPEIVFWPVPICPRDDTFLWMKRFVSDGGRLYVSGDISYGFHRQRNRTDRLRELAGLSVGAERYRAVEVKQGPGVGRALRISDKRPELAAWSRGAEGLPCLDVIPEEARVLARDPDGSPVWTEASLGAGTVIFNADPAELRCAYFDSDPGLHGLYRYVIEGSGNVRSGSTITVEPWSADLHVMKPPVSEGDLWVLFNRGESADFALDTGRGPLNVFLDERRPGLVLTGDQGELLAVEAQGKVVREGIVIHIQGHVAILALDRRDLADSNALLILPFKQGSIEIQRTGGDALAIEAGDFKGGRWCPLEDIDLRYDVDRDQAPRFLSVSIDEDRVHAVFLVCAKGELDRWRKHLGSFAAHGYAATPKS